MADQRNSEGAVRMTVAMLPLAPTDAKNSCGMGRGRQAGRRGKGDCGFSTQAMQVGLAGGEGANTIPIA